MRRAGWTRCTLGMLLHLKCFASVWGVTHSYFQFWWCSDGVLSSFVLQYWVCSNILIFYFLFFCKNFKTSRLICKKTTLLIYLCLFSMIFNLMIWKLCPLLELLWFNNCANTSCSTFGLNFGLNFWLMMNNFMLYLGNDRRSIVCQTNHRLTGDCKLDLSPRAAEYMFNWISW